MAKFSAVVADIGKGILWPFKEIGKGFSELHRLITLSKDVEEETPVLIPQTTQLVRDAGALAEATAKDSGAFLQATAACGEAIENAVAKGALDLQADEAVAAAVENLITTLRGTNVADIVAAWKKLVDDSQTLGVSVDTALQKLNTAASS